MGKFDYLDALSGVALQEALAAEWEKLVTEKRPYLGQRCHIEGKGFGTMDELVAEARQQDEREASEDAQERYTFACICGWRKTLCVDDLAAYYEKPFAPCGHPWECLDCVG